MAEREQSAEARKGFAELERDARLLIPSTPSFDHVARVSALIVHLGIITHGRPIELLAGPGQKV